MITNQTWQWRNSRLLIRARLALSVRMMKTGRAVMAAMVLLTVPFNAIADSHSTQEEAPTSVVATTKLSKTDITAFFQTVLSTEQDQIDGLAHLQKHWHPSFVPMALEMIQLANRSEGATAMLGLMVESTDKVFGHDLNQWYQWIWSTDENRHPHYALFKSSLYELLDPKFKHYFNDEFATRIRLDEVRWGGVKQDGIPPLRQPTMISVDEADYLDDDNVVFGIEVNGDARAYPKRILAWHEMFVDTVGGEPVAGVYCTLCGTVILYKTTVDGVVHELGTSGFLYRSNKLMYDKKTQSLWSTMRGEPVIGELAESGIQLERSFVVTTTWGEWKRRHPKSTVLSLDTGHTRDYGEGVAYKEYFATDDLMFTIPQFDMRLYNKDEVLGIVFDQNRDQQLALTSAWLNEHPLHEEALGDVKFIVVTDPSGANRVYERADDVQFTEYDGQDELVDAAGTTWTLTEAALVASNGRTLNRLPAHRAFWFGWHAAFPDTRLVK